MSFFRYVGLVVSLLLLWVAAGIWLIPWWIAGFPRLSLNELEFWRMGFWIVHGTPLWITGLGLFLIWGALHKR